MKKLVSILMAIAMLTTCIFALASCENTAEKVKIGVVLSFAFVTCKSVQMKQSRFSEIKTRAELC